MKIRLSEKASSDYIFIDRNNKVHIIVPINGGIEVGLDNTCRAASEITDFFLGNKSKKIKNIIEIIDIYINDLTHDIEFISSYQIETKELAKKKDRLAQLNEYRKLLLEIITPTLLESLSVGHPHLPAPILNAMKAHDSNCIAARFAPENPDMVLRFDDPLFSLRRTISPNTLKEQIKLGIMPVYMSNKDKIKDPKQIAIETITNKFPKKLIANQTDLESLKDLIIKTLKEFGLSVTKEMLAKDKDNKATTFDYFSMIMCYDDETSIGEWVNSVISASSIEDVFSNFKYSPFLIKDNPPNPEKFRIKLQIFLALINNYHYEQTGIWKNFGEILEKDQALITRLINIIITAIKKDFDIENAIFDFIDSNSTQKEPNIQKNFFLAELSNQDKNYLREQFFRIWGTISESPHFDEFVFILANKKGDFHVHKSRISLNLKRYVQEYDINLYNKYYNSQILSQSIANQESVILTNQNLENVEIQITEEQFFNLKTSAMVKVLISDSGSNKFFDNCSPEIIEKLKQRPDWTEISSSIIKSGLSQKNIDSFTTIFGTANCYVLELNGLQSLYTEIAFKYSHHPNDNPLIFRSGLDKIKTALQVLEIPFNNIEFNDSGDFIITFSEESNSKELITKLLKIEEQNKNRIYIASYMAPTYYQAAESLTTPTQNIRAELAQLNNTVKDTRNSKMACALRHILNIIPYYVVAEDVIPGTGKINISYYHGNGYKVTGDPEFIRSLHQCYYNRLNITFDENQIIAFIQAVQPQSTILKKENIESALDKLKISYYGIRQIGKNFIIILENNESKRNLEKFCDPAQINAMKISNEFGIKYDYDTTNPEQPLFVFQFKSPQEREKFSAIIKQIAKPAISYESSESDSVQKVVIHKIFLKLIDMNSLRSLSLSLDYPTIRNKVMENVSFLNKSFNTRASFNENLTTHTLESFEFLINDSDTLNRGMAIYFMKKYGCKLVERKTHQYLVIQANLLVNLDTQQIVSNILTYLNKNKQLQLKPRQNSKNTDPTKIDYKILISETTLNEIKNYKQALILKAKTPGGYLADRLAFLKKEVKDLSLEEFIDVIFQTKVPSIFAESEIIGNGFDWNKDELIILGNLSVSVPTKIYDDGKFVNPSVHEQPFDGNLVFIPGALLANKSGHTVPPDREAVVKSNIFTKKNYVDDEALYRLYENRILPVLLHINQIMFEKQTDSSNPKAFITIPGIGCGQFSAEFQGELGEKLKQVLIKLLENHGDKLPLIKGVYYHPYNECSSQRKNIKHINFLCRPISANDNSVKYGLNPPSYYEENPGEFQNCELFSLVAWDHVSWITNDLIRGDRNTDDGTKGAATNALTKITGYPGYYYQPNPTAPKYTPLNYETWEECIGKEELSFPAINRVYITHKGKLEKLRHDSFSKAYHFPKNLIKKMMTQFQSEITPLNLSFQETSEQPEKFKQLLNTLGIETLKIKIYEKNGFRVKIYPEDFEQLTKKTGIPFHLSPNIALLIYREVTRKGCKNQLNGLVNDDVGGIKGRKLKTALEILNIHIEDIDFHINKNGKSTNNGYNILIQKNELAKINTLLENFNNNELSTIKKLVNNKLEIFSKSKEFPFFKSKRISALMNTISNATELMTIFSLVSNQQELATKSFSNFVIPENVCPTQWTTTCDDMPSNSKLFADEMQDLLDEITLAKASFNNANVNIN